MGNIGHYIDGNNVEGKSGLNKPVFNPATGTSEKNVDLASIEEVNKAEKIQSLLGKNGLTSHRWGGQEF